MTGDEWPVVLAVFGGGLFGFFGALGACEVALAMMRSSDQGGDS